VVKVARQLSELRARSILLALLLLHQLLLVVGVEESTNLLILSLHVVKVLLAGVEIVLVLAGVESAVAMKVG
jgi:hypothetical protein